MSWKDDWLYPDSADLDGDGDVDFNERAEYDYMYDSIMGTNMSGFCPENDVDTDYYEDDEDDEDDEGDEGDEDEDEDEKAEEYSFELDLEFITEADWDGYFTDDGEFHCWEIPDMFDYSDEDGFWDKCGRFHDYSEPSALCISIDNYTDNMDEPEETVPPLAEVKPENDFDNNFSEKSFYSFLYDKFPEIGNYYSKKQFEKDPSLLYMIYPLNRSVVVKCWDWVLRTYSEKFLNDPQFKCVSSSFFETIPYVALGEDSKINKGVFAKHLMENPDLFEILFSKQPYDLDNSSLYQFLTWCIIMDDLDFFKKAYETILNNKNYVDEPAEKAYIIEKVMHELSELANEKAPARFYEYLKSEIKSVPRKGIIPYLLEKLDKGYYGFQQFLKPRESDEIVYSDTVVGKIYSKAYGQFPEMADYVAPLDLEKNLFEFLGVYMENRPLAADFWAWIIENYAEQLNSNNQEYHIMSDDYFEILPAEMFKRDGEDQNRFLQRYLSERPELLELLFSKRPYNFVSDIAPQFLAWSIIRNDFSSFEKVYEMVLNNKECVYSPFKKEHIIEPVLSWLKKFAKTSASEKFYAFLKDEIESVTSYAKKRELLNMLDEKADGKNIFIKPKNCQNSANTPQKATLAPAVKQTSKEPESTAAKAAKPTADDSVLNELLERKRVLESMLKELDNKIAGINASKKSRNTTPEKEKDEFFDYAGVAGMKYCDSEAIYDIRPNAKLNLVREPENPHDKNAVAVHDQHGRKVGYITKQTNIPVARAIDGGEKLYAKVVTLPLYEKYPNMKILICSLFQEYQ